MTTWDDFKIKTTPKCERGTIYMHPDDAAEMRPLTFDAIVSRIGPKRLPPPQPEQRYQGHRDNGDDAARERIARQLEQLKAAEAARAAGGGT